MRTGRVPRLYVPDLLVGAGAVTLGEAPAHYLRNVLRLAGGSEVCVFNERDGEWQAMIAEIGKSRLTLDVVSQRRQACPEPGPWLVLAPLKRARIDWLVEKATELGAAAIFPVWTARTQVERLNLDRLRLHAIEAAEQCERLSVPEIRAPERLDRLLETWPMERRLFLCDESGTAPSIAAVLADLQPQPVALLVGPEGGWTESELDALGKLPIVTRVGLGPRILRAETAALAGLATMQAILGDWRSP